MQGVGGAPSREQTKVADPAVEWKAKVADAEAEGLGGVGAGREHQGQALPQRRRRSAVGVEFGDVAAAQQQPRFLDPGARDVARVRAKDEHQGDPAQRGSEPDEQHALQQPAPAGPGALDDGAYGVHRSPTR